MGPGCTLKAPFSQGDIFGSVNRHYDVCPATDGADTYDFAVTDAYGVMLTSHFLVVWDEPL